MTPNFKRHERGQELVELAITLPLLLMLVFAIFDVGRGIYYYSSLQNAAREGARFAAVHASDEAGIISMIEARMEARAVGLDPDDITANVNWTNDTVTVTADFSYELVIPFVDAIFPGGIVSMQSRSTMLREKW